MKHKNTIQAHDRAEIYTQRPSTVDVYVDGHRRATFRASKETPSFIFRLDYRGSEADEQDTESVVIDAVGDYLQMAINHLQMLEVDTIVDVLSLFGLMLKKDGLSRWKELSGKPELEG